MKKLLFGILTFLGIGLSFCSAEFLYYPDGSLSSAPLPPIRVGSKSFSSSTNGNVSVPGISVLTSGSTSKYNIVCFTIYSSNSTFKNSLISVRIRVGSSYDNTNDPSYTYTSSDFYNNYGRYVCFSGYSGMPYIHTNNQTPASCTDCNVIAYEFNSSKYDIYNNSSDYMLISNIDSLYCENNGLCSNSNCGSSTINVLYNNENSTETITCDGDSIIQIDGFSTITNTNKFTPYYNITYRDEDNQLLTESYSKGLLTLLGGNFKKTYTDDNEWILSVQGSSNDNNEFTGYIPAFDVVFTGDIVDTGNIFNNFAENSLKFTLSNIPNYIQYVIIIMLLFFVLGFIRRFKRK